MWLATALSRNLCELFLINEYSNEKPNILPSRLYTCKSLVILKLRGEIRPDVPRLSCLPSLKTLELLLDKYFQGGPLRRFLFICPVLENLLMNCGWDDYDKGLITVTVPSLQRLTLYLHSQTEGGMLPRGLVIDSPSLKYLKLRDRHQWSRPGFSIETMPDLEEAYDHDDRDYEELISTVRTVRESVLSNLRTFNWSRYFERRPQEMDLAVYILGEKWSLKDCNNLV
ncbi:FBD-associated F-box protein At4g10400 [Brassica rapa]|uniref:FBD-associated F-box protein At4g10400 n=1 Tax=Brassica campestris TaxID=3711 RepID=UPI00142D2489|nr:FBD-associated F-box protein At4g10400 [Brassica rapa]